MIMAFPGASNLSSSYALPRTRRVAKLFLQETNQRKNVESYRGLETAGAINSRDSIRNLPQTTSSQADDEAPDAVDGSPELYKKAVNFITVPSKIPFTKFDFVFLPVPIVLYLLDIALDFRIAYQHYEQIEEHRSYFALTITFILLSWFFVAGFNIRWLIHEFRHSKEYNKKPTSKPVFALELVLGIIFGPCVHNALAMLYWWHGSRKGVASDKRQMYYDEMQFERQDACLLSLLEAFLESAPQFILQFWIVLQQDLPEDDLNRFMTIISISVSCLSLAWSVVSYHRALRLARPDRENISILAVLTRFVWRICEVAPRIIAFSLFLSAVKWYGVFFVIAHFASMYIWIAALGTKFCGHMSLEWLFVFSMAVIWTFCFLNVQDRRTRKPMLIYYTVFYIENIAMCLYWYFNKPEPSSRIWEDYREVFLGVVIGCFWVSVLVIIIYYATCHPLKHKIEKCLSTDYWCSCYEKNSTPQKTSDTELGEKSERENLNSGDNLSLSADSRVSSTTPNQTTDDTRSDRLNAAESGDIPNYNAPTPRPASVASDNPHYVDTNQIILNDNEELDQTISTADIKPKSSKLIRRDTVPDYNAPVPPNNNYGVTIPGGIGSSRMFNMKLSPHGEDRNSQGQTLPGSGLGSMTVDELQTPPAMSRNSPSEVRKSMRAPVPQPRESLLIHQNDVPQNTESPFTPESKNRTDSLLLTPEHTVIKRPLRNDDTLSDVDTPTKEASTSTDPGYITILSDDDGPTFTSPDTPMKI